MFEDGLLFDFFDIVGWGVEWYDIVYVIWKDVCFREVWVVFGVWVVGVEKCIEFFIVELEVEVLVD